MQYVCRSCFLRLGQPWRQRASRRQRPSSSPRLLPHTIRRGNHCSASYAEVSGQENHGRPPQQQFNPVSTIDGTSTSSNEHNAWEHTTHGLDEEETLASFSTQTQHPERDPLITKIPKPRIKLTPSTFTVRDSRLQFVKELDSLDEKSWGFAKVLRRFAEWELFQRERLEKVIGSRPRDEVIKVYGAWKSLVKDAFTQPSTANQPKTMKERRILFWIRDSKTMNFMMRSLPAVRTNGVQNNMERTRLLISVALRYAPDRLRMLTECVLRDQRRHRLQYYDFFVIEDVLELLATHLRRADAGVRQAYAENMADMVIFALEGFGTNLNVGGVHISQATIHPILDALPADAVETWYHRLQEAKCHLHPFTQLHFASRIAKSSTAGKLSSVRILDDLARTGLLDINSPVAASVCTSILTFGKKDLAKLDDQSATPADLFRHLHDIGMVPNVITYTAIIRGLCLKKDLKTALDVFEIMKHHGVQPDEYTYSILINGCKLCRDFRLLTQFALEVCSRNIRDPVIWNEILHGVYICCLRAPRNQSGSHRTAIHAMNEIYSRIFDSTLLKPFITGRLAEVGELLVREQHVPEDIRLMAEIPPLPPKEAIRPGTDTLSIMLLGLIRSLAMPYDVVVFYSHFREMLRQGHPAANRLVLERGTYVHDIVLRHLLKFKGSLRVALDIIRDMMRDIGEDAGSKPNQAGLMQTAEAHALTPVVADTEAPAANTDEDMANIDGSANHTGTSEPLVSGEGPDSFIEGATRVAEASPWSTEPPQSGAHVPHEDDDVASRSDLVRHPAPSVYTWSILVYGFMRHKLPREAERILTLMREHGVEPNAVTYNTLAAGYAKLQKIPQAVKAMQRLEAEGFESDDSTLRAFSYISNKQRAINLMEAAVEKNSMKLKAVELQAHDAEDATGVRVVGEDSQEADLASKQPEEEDDDDDDETLDQDLEERFVQTDLGYVPEYVSKKIHDPLKSLKAIAPVHERSDLKEWARIREQGLSALSQPLIYDLNGRLDLDSHVTSKGKYR